MLSVCIRDIVRKKMSILLMSPGPSWALGYFRIKGVSFLIPTLKLQKSSFHIFLKASYVIEKMEIVPFNLSVSSSFHLPILGPKTPSPPPTSINSSQEITTMTFLPSASLLNPSPAPRNFRRRNQQSPADTTFYDFECREWVR